MTDMQKKLPSRVQLVVDRVRKGERLQRTFCTKANGEKETLFSFQPSGRPAPPKSSQDAIDSGLLRALGDGLFGDDTSQTYGT